MRDSSLACMIPIRQPALKLANVSLTYWNHRDLRHTLLYPPDDLVLACAQECTAACPHLTRYTLPSATVYNSRFLHAWLSLHGDEV